MKKTPQQLIERKAIRTLGESLSGTALLNLIKELRFKDDADSASNYEVLKYVYEKRFSMKLQMH